MQLGPYTRLLYHFQLLGLYKAPTSSHKVSVVRSVPTSHDVLIILTSIQRQPLNLYPLKKCSKCLLRVRYR